MWSRMPSLRGSSKLRARRWARSSSSAWAAPRAWRSSGFASSWGCVRVGQGRGVRWRELSAILPTSISAPIALSIDKNGRQVSHEITAKRLRKLLEPVVGQRIFINTIGPQHSEASLSVNWRQFVKFSVEGPGAIPVVQWNVRAIDHMGLGRQRLRDAITPIVSPEIQERVL